MANGVKETIMSTTTTRRIELENIGPIDRLSIPLPEAGVVVLHGRNGTGKTHALAAVDSLVSGRGKPPCRDGALRGQVEGFGARLTIGRSTKRVGEAEVVSLEGRLDISQLVAPPIKDEEAADRHRIKALIQLSGAKPDAAAFESILPEGMRLAHLVLPGEIQQDDPVTLAAKAKRSLEQLAREHEKKAQDATLRLRMLEESLDRALLTFPLERDQAEAQWQEALLAQRELATRQKAAEEHQQTITALQTAVHNFRALVPEGTTLEGLEHEAAKAASDVQRLERELDVARERARQLAWHVQRAKEAHADLENLKKLLAVNVAPVGDEELAQAKQRVEAARVAYEKALAKEKAQTQLAQVASVQREIDDQTRQAQVLRDSAQSLDDVLSQMVGQITAKLRVQSGQLVCQTDRGLEPFRELSAGERWRLVLEIAAEQVGRGGLVTVPQEAWEALDPVHRQEIAKIAKEVGVVILTAEADAQEQITAEILV
jgi:energy-coupling factor transporter ATP-binding protein EcfA2